MTLCTALCKVSDAVTVMVLLPSDKGTAAALQVVLPDAVPLEPWSVCQVTVSTPCAPVLVPAIDVVEPTVEEFGKGVVMASVRLDAGLRAEVTGAAVAAGPYMLWTPAISPAAIFEPSR